MRRALVAAPLLTRSAVGGAQVVPAARDAPNSQWRADPGAYAIMVGSSSADIALTGHLALTSTLTAKP